jgi:hypothetical protein
MRTILLVDLLPVAYCVWASHAGFIYSYQQIKIKQHQQQQQQQEL